MVSSRRTTFAQAPMIPGQQFDRMIYRPKNDSMMILSNK